MNLETWKDVLPTIYEKKNRSIMDAENENSYNSFLTNRALSYQVDCILLANEMNTRHFTDKRLQFDFLIGTVKPRKRWYAKWIKPEKHDDLELIKDYFGYSTRLARQMLPILTEDQIEELRLLTEKGGVSGSAK